MAVVMADSRAACPDAWGTVRGRNRMRADQSLTTHDLRPFFAPLAQLLPRLGTGTINSQEAGRFAYQGGWSAERTKP